MLATLRSLTTASAILLAAPLWAGETVLTISGAVGASETGDSWEFDMDGLKALPSASFETTTTWTEGDQRFDGVPLVVLMEHVGASGNALRAVALNDYAVSIPMTDSVQGGPIVAYLRNGEEMSVRDKGPLWIIYPFDDNDSYKTEEYYSRSIWQLDRIEVVVEN